MSGAAPAAAAESEAAASADSIGGRVWRRRPVDERTALALAQTYGLPDIVAGVLAARGVDAAGADRFLNPTLRDALPDPLVLADMAAAVDRLKQAILGGEKVAVFGDYDVDGATSAALLARFFRALGQPIAIYIPDRLSEGYGPNAPALRRLKADGISLVVTVDCGTLAHDALGEAEAAGLDIVVLDHHVAAPRLPPAAAVVNPNRLDEDGALGGLAAVGVTFLLVVALNRALRDEYWYGEGHPEPDLMALLDLVALGTVCDVVPLTGVNRALVAQGLKVMAKRGNAGIAALADVAGLDEAPGVYHAGFILGPRVNAGGRVGESGLGARLLATDDAAEAAALALRLDAYNRERQEIEAAVQADALAQAEASFTDADNLVLVAGAGWHQGVIGIVAGRLRERFNRPALVVALDNGIARGSGRSVPGVALGPAIVAARQAGHLTEGGGHAMAAGFTLEAARLEAFRDFLARHIEDQLGGALPPPMLELDGALSPAAASLELVETLEQIGPFGPGNPRPRFAFPAVAISGAGRVGADHVRCRLVAPGGGPGLKAIAFRAAGTPLGRALLARGGALITVAGHLRIDTWQGRRSVSLTIEDAMAG